MPNQRPSEQPQLRGRVEISANPLQGQERQRRLARLRGHLEAIRRRVEGQAVNLTPEQHERLHGEE